MISAPPTESPRITRRQFLTKGLVAGAGTLALGSYSSLVEPNHIVTRHTEFVINRLPAALDGFRIAHISDIHFGEYLGESHLRDVVKHVNAAKPDLVAITGDFVTRPWGRHRHYRPAARRAEPCAAILHTLEARLGTIGVLGNHDHATDPEFVDGALTSQGIRVLRNQATPLEISGSRLWIAGIDDAVEHAADLSGTMSQVPSGEPCVALFHEPDTADWVCKHPVDLQLSGHSHGGQVRLPLLGAPVLPEKGRRYPLGHYRIQNLHLYTNPGIGVITLPVRFDCPPEVTIHTLRSVRT